MQAIPLDDASREWREVERLGGKAAVQTVKFNRWFGSLWHGQRLAYTLAALSALLAFACHRVAELAGEE